MFNLFTKYSQYCPKCRAFHLKIWKECSVCHSSLISTWRWLFFKAIKAVAALFFLIVVFCFFSYCIQKSERPLYERGCAYVLEGNLQQARSEFAKAFSCHPLVKFVQARWTVIRDHGKTAWNGVWRAGERP